MLSGLGVPQTFYNINSVLSLQLQFNYVYNHEFCAKHTICYITIIIHSRMC